MLLTIDVGNTNITMGIFENNLLLGSFRLTTTILRTSDEYGIAFQSFFKKIDIDHQQIEGVIISSVVPKIMYSLINSIKKYVNVEPFVIGPGIKTGIKINADNPKEVGADRIVNAVAAYNIYKRNCLIVDFGTATTFDYISKEGEFCYTIIAPGIQIAAEALTNQTAKLPEIEIKKPKTILAKNTIHGMQAGLVYGYIGQVKYIIKKIKEELDEDIFILATGGLGRIIYQEVDDFNTYDPNIAFKGMKIIYDKNKI